jgi:preprotein translocase subunit SecY
VPYFIAGAMFITWLSEEMSMYGIGNGVSVMITMSVCGVRHRV